MRGLTGNVVALQRLQSEIAHRGFYSFKVSAADFLDPYDPRVRSKPELYEVAMNSQLSSQLSDTTIVTVGGTPPRMRLEAVTQAILSCTAQTCAAEIARLQAQAHLMHVHCLRSSQNN